VFRLDSRGDELRTIASHLRQELLSALIDERDITEVHDGPRTSYNLAAVLPTPAQLNNPWTR